jgi:thioredoxin 1
MKHLKNLVILGALTAAIAAVLVLKREREAAVLEPTSLAAPPAAAAAPAVLPRLLELGADKCIPCKMMAPILAELRQEYAGQLQVDFIDVWKDESAGEKYGVRVIPLQIFFAADGRELFRHEGFFAKMDILAKWRELGVNLP